MDTQRFATRFDRPQSVLLSLMAMGTKQANVGMPGGGAVQGQVTLRNMGSQKCTVSGFLKLRVVSHTGRVLKVTERHIGTPAAAAITLGPGMVGRAAAAFTWLNWCKGATVRSRT